MSKYKVRNSVSYQSYLRDGKDVFHEILAALIREKPQLMKLAIEYYGEDFSEISGEWISSSWKLHHLYELHTVSEVRDDLHLFHNELGVEFSKFAYKYCREKQIIGIKKTISGATNTGYISHDVRDIIEQAKRDKAIIASGEI